MEKQKKYAVVDFSNDATGTLGEFSTYEEAKAFFDGLDPRREFELEYQCSNRMSTCGVAYGLEERASEDMWNCLDYKSYNFADHEHAERGDKLRDDWTRDAMVQAILSELENNHLITAGANVVDAYDDDALFRRFFERIEYPGKAREKSENGEFYGLDDHSVEMLADELRERAA